MVYLHKKNEILKENLFPMILKELILKRFSLDVSVI